MATEEVEGPVELTGENSNDETTEVRSLTTLIKDTLGLFYGDFNLVVW